VTPETRDRYLARAREAWVAERDRRVAAGDAQDRTVLPETRQAMGLLSDTVWAQAWGAGVWVLWPALLDMWTPLLQRVVLHGDDSSRPAAELLDALLEVDARLRYLDKGVTDPFGDPVMDDYGNKVIVAVESLDLLRRIIDRAEDAVTAGDRLLRALGQAGRPGAGDPAV
jgi:hypothetical protein